jgi:rhodanese-related sulfurtransferase
VGEDIASTPVRDRRGGFDPVDGPGLQESAPGSKGAPGTAGEISPAEAAALIRANRGSDSLVIIDVSTRREYFQWHLEKAININIFSLKLSEKLNKLDKDKTYLVYCKMGGRSLAAHKVMRKLGFREVYNIRGGRVRWQMENLPFVSGLADPSKPAFCPVMMTMKTVAWLRTVLKGMWGSSIGPATPGADE